MLVLDVSTLEVHMPGGWEVYTLNSRVEVIPGETSVLARVVLPEVPDIQSMRITAELSLVVPDQHIRVTPARGIQIGLRDQTLESDAVNHVKVSLEGHFSRPGPHEWTLDGTLPATVEVEPADMATAVATPEQGAVLTLDDGFELEIPPGAVSEDFIAWVERVDDGDASYYLLGPDGTTFLAPVTVTLPADDGEPLAAWDAEVLTGQFDDEDRVVVTNDHFSCVERIKKQHESLVQVNEAVSLFEERVCGVSYSVAIVDLDNPNVEVGPLHSTEVLPADPDCAGQRAFIPNSVATMFPKRTGYERAIAMQGDNYLGGFFNGCPRDLLVVGGDPIRGVTNTQDRFTLGFGTNGGNGVSVQVGKGPAVFDLDEMMTSRYRYIRNNGMDFTYPYPEPGDPQYGVEYEAILIPETSRSAVGFTEDRRFMIMAVADDKDNGFQGHEWAHVLMRDRTVSIDGQDVLVDVYDAYRMDEGASVDMQYNKGGDTLKEARGALWYGSYVGTVNALGVYMEQPECLNASYSVTSHACPNWTVANGQGAGGGELMEVCGQVDPNTGAMIMKARKFADGDPSNDDFGVRPYYVRVSGVENGSCGPDNLFAVSAGNADATGIETDQLVFEFDSIWVGDQAEKAYCVTAAAQAGDVYTDPLTAWWWSDKVNVARDCGP